MKYNFKTKVKEINGIKVVLIPHSISFKFTSRASVMVEGEINGNHFKTVLEPDGNGSHWLHLPKSIISDDLNVLIEQSDNWIVPNVPKSFNTKIRENKLEHFWESLTPLAKWEWIRWIKSTKNKDTVIKRENVSISKMKSGKRRPCCFNTRMCCDIDVSTNGVLLTN